MSWSSLPSTVGVPNEVKSQLDYQLPVDARSNSIRIYASNSPTISQTYTVQAGAIQDGLSFPSSQILFDFPVSQSPSAFLDNRLTTLHYKMTISTVNAGTTCALTSGYLRSNANSFFDLLRVRG